MPRSRSPSAGRPSRRSRSLASFDSLGAPLALPVPSGARRHPLAPSTSSAAALAAGFSSPLPAVPYFISRLCSSLAAFAAARLLADPVAAPPVAVATALAASAAATAAAAFRRSVPVRPSAAALAAGAPVAAQLAAWVGAVAVLGALRALLLAAVAAAPVAAALRPRGGSSSPSSTAALGVGGGGVTASVARGRRTVVAVAVLVGLAALLTADMDAGSAAGGRRMIFRGPGGAGQCPASRRCGGASWCVARSSPWWRCQYVGQVRPSAAIPAVFVAVGPTPRVWRRRRPAHYAAPPATLHRRPGCTRGRHGGELQPPQDG